MTTTGPPTYTGAPSTSSAVSSTPLISTSSTSSIDPALALLLVGTVGAALLVPIAVAFCYVCSRMQPRSFFLGCLSVVALGLAQGAINVFVQTQSLRGESFPSTNNLLVSLVLVIPIVAQTALLINISSIYTWPALSSARRTAVLLPPFLLKLARFVLLGLCINDVHQKSQDLLPSGISAASWLALWGREYAQILWVLQSVDDLYSAALLLFHRRRGTTGFLPRRRFSLGMATGSSFALPVFLDIAQLIFSYLPATNPRNGHYAALYIALANTYAETISLLLVALWHPRPPTSVPRTSPPLPDTADPTSATRFLSPLPEHPRIEFFPTSSSDGSSRDSATLHADSDSALGADAEKLKIMEVYPQAALAGALPRGGWVLEPSVCSFNGSIQTDAQGEPVFYAV